MGPPAVTASCRRCGRSMEEEFGFCPKCGLPVSAPEVLSTQIHEIHRRPTRRGAGAGEWRRFLLPAGTMVMLTFVIGLGLLLFSQDLLDRVLPRPEAGVGPVETVPPWEPEWVVIPGWRGIEPEDSHDDYLMSKYEVPNELWLDFLRMAEDELREDGVWAEVLPGRDTGWTVDAAGRPDVPVGQMRRPVRNVSLLAADRFCRWLTRRLGDPGWRIRVPTNSEWEWAAEGPDQWLYPWGMQFMLEPAPRIGPEARPPMAVFRNEPLLVNAVTDDISPHGVVAMGTNVCEWAVADGVPAEAGAIMAPQHAYKRGASVRHTYKQAEQVAQVRDYRQVEARLPAPDTGIRLVKVRVRP